MFGYFFAMVPIYQAGMSWGIEFVLYSDALDGSIISKEKKHTTAPTNRSIVVAVDTWLICLFESEIELNARLRLFRSIKHLGPHLTWHLHSFELHFSRPCPVILHIGPVEPWIWPALRDCASTIPVQRSKFRSGTLLSRSKADDL